MLPLGFAPFHLPGFSLLGLALFFAQLQFRPRASSFLTGLFFGFGYFGFGVSWIYVSIHEYGHLNIALSALATFMFVGYLALYPAILALLYRKLATHSARIISCLLFSSLWCGAEYLRSHGLGGFPWLLLGIGQIDTPLSLLFPLIGIYGVGFLCCFAATSLAYGTVSLGLTRLLWLTTFVGILITPNVLTSKTWIDVSLNPISVGIVQANLSMRDKRDETLFWQLLQRYDNYLHELIGKTSVIVLPESAIPVPASYLSDFLSRIDGNAQSANSAVLLGIPEPSTTDSTHYTNTITALGHANGHYLKQHLVPFGEYIPNSFQWLVRWLSLPTANLVSGHAHQIPIDVNNHPIASLICYELAYPELLRQQLPNAEWIVSVSDDGWFGHSLAMYQQQQMAQVLSQLTGRFQIVSNNDGLSSTIDTEGHITASLPALTAGVLISNIYPAKGTTPWTLYGDIPILSVVGLILMFSVARNFCKGHFIAPIAARRKRRYPYQPN